jgi:tRNA A37 threonylcarbamoyladenosine synthetase subunit TsaC/SUA5/YrdC
MMQDTDYRNLNLKKLKKDGSIPWENVETISRRIEHGDLFILPVDSIYGIVGLYCNETIEKITELTGDIRDNIEVVISNFKMLEEMAVVGKTNYDFLRRIWPGEVIVQLRNRACFHNSNFLMRMPRHKYVLDIINSIGKPLVYLPLKTPVRKMVLNDKDIIKRFKNICPILIIDEFLKDHTSPTLIDLSCDNIVILNEGRVCAEEIKSLYFLGDL